MGKTIWSLFKYFFKMYTATHWCCSKLKPAPAQCFLENYLQHPKKSYFSDIQNGVIFSFRCTKWHGAHLTTCAKKHKKVWKSWKGNTTLAIYTTLMHSKFTTVLSIIWFNYFVGNWSWNFGINVWKKVWFDAPIPSEQNIQIYSLYVATKYKFWKWRGKLFLGTILPFLYQKDH